MIKIKKTIYITPEVEGILAYEQQKTGMKMSELINRKLSASLENNNADFEKLTQTIVFELNKLAISQKKQINSEEYIINFLDYLWSSLQIQNVKPLSTCESLQTLKASLSKANHND